MSTVSESLAQQRVAGGLGGEFCVSDQEIFWKALMDQGSTAEEV